MLFFWSDELLDCWRALVALIIWGFDLRTTKRSREMKQDFIFKLYKVSLSINQWFITWWTWVARGCHFHTHICWTMKAFAHCSYVLGAPKPHRNCLAESKIHKESFVLGGVSLLVSFDFIEFAVAIFIWIWWFSYSI